MKRVRHSILWLLLLALAVASISWTLPTTLTLTDAHGAPASDAYVRYHYQGYLLNFVHPTTYVARGSVITRADAEGRVRIPFRVHFRSPLRFSTPPRLYVDDIVVPRLHNAFGPISQWTTTAPGVFETDDDRERFAVFDVSGDPERWERSLRSLFDCIRGTLADTTALAAPDDEQTAAHARELIVHLRQDFRALLDAHGQTLRTRPAPPERQSESERQEWAKRVDEHIAREPLLGPYLERMWRQNFNALDKLEATLKSRSPPS